MARTSVLPPSSILSGRAVKNMRFSRRNSKFVSLSVITMSSCRRVLCMMVISSMSFIASKEGGTIPISAMERSEKNGLLINRYTATRLDGSGCLCVLSKHGAGACDQFGSVSFRCLTVMSSRGFNTPKSTTHIGLTHLANSRCSMP